MLKGKITGLRAIEESDLPHLLEWRNKPEFRRYFREYRELSIHQQKQWYEKIAVSDPNTIMFAVVDLVSGELIGAAGLCHINWVNRNADFSLYIGKDHAYIELESAADAAKTMSRYAFEELAIHRLWAEIYDFDLPKQELFAKLGFQLDGQHRETYWSDGKWHDSLFYSLLDREFIAE